MISAGVPEVYTPFGRDHFSKNVGIPSSDGRKGIGSCHLPSSSLRTDAGEDILDAIRDFTLADNVEDEAKVRTKEDWILREYSGTDDGHCEDELYFNGSTAVCSRGGSVGCRQILVSMTVESKIEQALWCNFMFGFDTLKSAVSDTNDKASISCICLVASDRYQTIYIFSNKGEEFAVPLPFPVLKVWPSKYGLLLERKVSVTSGQQNETARLEQDFLPTLFSLLHPLDDVTPITRRSGGGKFMYVANSSQRVVFSSEDSSLIVTYDTQLGIHSIFRVRKAKLEEGWSSVHMFDSSFTAMQHSSSDKRQSSGTPVGCSVAAISSRSHFTHSSHSPSQNSSSPFRGLLSRGNSPLTLLSRPQSPLVTSLQHGSSISRSQSPLTVSALASQPHLASPSPNSRMSANLSRTPLSANTSINDRSGGKVEPLLPNLCLEPVWIEPKSSFTREGNTNGQATKVFFTHDVVGQKFICFLVKHHHHLRCMKVEEANDRTQLIFGSVSLLSARDAVPLHNDSLMVILDLTGGLVVYSGTTKICKVHTPLVASQLGPLLGSGMTRAHVPPSSSRRNSMVTSSRPPSAMDANFDEEMCMLSPVPTEASVSMMTNIQEGSFSEESSSSSGGIVSLHDPVRNQFNIELANGQMHRLTIPTMSSSSLVDAGLEALRLVLPRDLTIQLFSKWFLSRRAPGSTELTALQDWMSFMSFLLSSMGYDVDRIPTFHLFDPRSSLPLEAPAKKFKPSESGCMEDWEYLRRSLHSRLSCSSRGRHTTNLAEEPISNANLPCQINNEAPLFPHIPAILYVFHVFYEELKLDVSQWSILPHFAKFLYILARDLRVNPFMDHYWRDFSDVCTVDSFSVCLDEDALSNLLYPSFLTSEAPCIHRWLEDYLNGKEMSPFPYIPDVSKNTQAVVLLYSVLLGKMSVNNVSVERCLRPCVASGYRLQSLKLPLKEISGSCSSCYEATVIMMLRLGLQSSDLDTLPFGVALNLRGAIHRCRKNPPSDWSIDAYILIGREDLAAQIDSSRIVVTSSSRCSTRKVPIVSESKKPAVARDDDDDGMEGLDREVLQLLFGRDLRIAEVRRLLQSSKPVRIALVQRQEVGDHDFVEEKERHLYAICIRTMAVPVGRGMFTLHSLIPVVTEPFPIPKLCLTGRCPPRNTVVDLSHIDVPTNMNVWPLFHNGVAAGLRVAPNATGIDSTWIVYNKPKGNNDMPVEHAGFLMALGLNGHLKNLDIMNVYDYVAKGHEMTSVGLLLGIAATKGTKDVSATKLLSIHVEALLPPTSTELDIPHVIQVAAILGIGLVYQGTAHRHIAEVLLGEIGRPPGPEMENSTDRESYSLAAGLALGLVTLAKGSNIAGLSDLRMADLLYHYMVGGPKRQETGPLREKYRNTSYQIKEGDQINVNVTSPAATLALGLMFFKTGNNAISEWMVAPDTQYLLDFVRPDFLLLRTLSKGLIMWDDILPTASWVDGHLPEIIVSALKDKDRSNSDLDYETLSQAYCNIVAGACLAMGLRFAGSANQDAYKTLLKFSRTFVGLVYKSVLEQAGRNTVETCTNVVLLALSIVMAGTGDLEVLRMCRHLHLRVGSYHSHIHYGSHMAVHMAIGFLFFGGGRYTLNTDSMSIAALVCSLFPKFPMHSNDNRYHLQAFRHLYVLAACPRLVVPRDIDTGRACYTHLSVTFKPTKWYRETSVVIKAPCLLPNPDLLSEVKVCDSRYWTVVFSSGKNWSTLTALLERDGNLFVKQKLGCLSYAEDPKGFKSLLAQSLVQRRDRTWSAKPEAILAITSNTTIHNIVSSFLKQHSGRYSSNEVRGRELMTRLIHNCLSCEKVELFPTFVSLVQLGLSRLPSSLEMWQLRLVFVCETNRVSSSEEGIGGGTELQLVDSEFLVAIDCMLDENYKRWSNESRDALSLYLKGSPLKELPSSLSTFLVRFGIPPPHKIPQQVSGHLLGQSIPVLFLQLCAAGVSIESCIRIFPHLSHRS